MVIGLTLFRDVRMHRIIQQWTVVSGRRLVNTKPARPLNTDGPLWRKSMSVMAMFRPVESPGPMKGNLFRRRLAQ
jgi:hypothetical protein